MIDVVEELRKDNAHKRLIDLRVFADALLLYRAAAKHVREHGAIVAHPRTGAPMENPYLKVQSTQGIVLAKMGKMRSDRVVSLLDDMNTTPGNER